MEVLRVPPYPIATTWEVPDANSPYVFEIEDLVDHSIERTELTSDAQSTLTYTIPRSKAQYDRDFAVKIYDTDLYGEIVTESNLTIYRPYIDPNMLGTTTQEIYEYKEYEIIARSIIDTYLQEGSGTGGAFYNHKLVVQRTGEGNDYFPVWHPVNRVLKVYENNVLVYDAENTPIGISLQNVDVTSGLVTLTTNISHGFQVGQTVTISGVVPSKFNGSFTVKEVPTATTFKLDNTTISATDNEAITARGGVESVWEYTYKPTLDNSAIMRVQDGIYNRMEQSPLTLPPGIGDLGYYGFYPIAFPRGYDYVFIVDAGFKAVPPDVEIAIKMLIEDIKCGKNDYYNRFVTEYSTDQFDIKFAPQFLEGTGNMIVDKILSNYKGTLIKPGLL
jgi:hypothetical protein